jgi:hypothetical protein
MLASDDAELVCVRSWSEWSNDPENRFETGIPVEITKTIPGKN